MHDNQGGRQLTKHPDLASFFLPSTMSNKRRPGFEIVHSATWWKDFHAARRERAARPAARAATDSTDGNILSGNTYTFIPGRSAPIVRAVGTPSGTKKSASTLSRAGLASLKKCYTAVRGSNSILASRANEEEQCFRRLIQGRRGKNSSALPPPSHPPHNRGEPEDDTSEALVNPEAIMWQLAHGRRQVRASFLFLCDSGLSLFSL